MSEHSSLIVERLWRLERGIERGQCEGLAFAHLNNLLRDPTYREEVLEKVIQGGTEPMKKLAREIQSMDSGEALMGGYTATPRNKPETASEAAASGEGRRGRPSALWLIPALGAALSVAAGFTLLNDRTDRIRADITSPTTWESGNTYVLEDTIYVRGTSLTIEAGARVEGSPRSALIVERDATLDARGSATEPVVFTSHQPTGERERGDWGGVVLLGNAPVNQPGAVIEGIEQGTGAGQFGGDDPGDSCGVLTYTRIEFAGYEVYKNNELNGLTLGGCGRNTIIRNVQVHRPLDDGIEMFGGTVDLKKVVITGAGDDSIDWDWGWQGRVQFALIQQYPDAGENAFEGDSNGNDHQASPRSEPTFYNVTLAGASKGSSQNRGMVLRGGTGGHFHNMIIDGYGLGVLDTRDEVATLTRDGQLTFTHNLIADTTQPGSSSETGDRDDDYGFDEKDWIRNPGNHNSFRMGTVLQPTARVIDGPGFSPEIPARKMTPKAPPQSEFFDESAHFQGALGPRTRDSWVKGWTAFPRD